METFAGIPPVAYLVKRIGGPHVRVEVLVQPGQDPHIFEPTPRQVVRLSKARLFFKIGMPFEERLTERIAAATRGPRLSIRPPASRAARESIPTKTWATDPHVWLAPRLLKQMAANVAAALSAADPPHAARFSRERAPRSMPSLDALDRRLAASLAPYRGQAFYVFHPAFGYFADAYGLRQESVEIEGKSPTPRQLVHLIQKARADGVKIIFLQPQFNQQTGRVDRPGARRRVVPMDRWPTTWWRTWTTWPRRSPQRMTDK